MKAHNITLDINRLNDTQLEQLAAMIDGTTNRPGAVKEINQRIAFLRGWMSEKDEADYLSAYC